MCRWIFTLHGSSTNMYRNIPTAQFTYEDDIYIYICDGDKNIYDMKFEQKKHLVLGLMTDLYTDHSGY